MEEIHVNVEHEKSVDSQASQNRTGPRSSERRLHAAAVLCLGLLSVFLLARLIGFGVHYHECSSLTGERDLLNARITGMAEELHRLQNLSKHVVLTCETSCPAGWRRFSRACYLLSDESGSWDKGREDCRDRGADLVVINSPEEQTFLFGLTKKDAWMGLNDRDEEGTWKWIDGTPLTLTCWVEPQPDNGGGDPEWGEEDCAHMRTEGDTYWNDLSCEASLQWICEKIA
ncbi:CD209 antigen-like protein C [Enoplosus armatus]|uniref:CD209 antigen-like protein C n=1 Tax=Enoplosus armatus TaxID=215367 RepID=UPI0039919CA2